MKLSLSIGSALFSMLLFIQCAANAQHVKKEIVSPPNVEQKVDALFSHWDNPESPGASVAVMHKGKILFKKGYGSANLEYDIPITPSTVFHIASISKQFTAFSILLLQEKGKLSIDDDIRKYIPEVPDFGHKITLRHLATHTSGMRDQWNLLAMAGWRLDDVITKEHVMSIVENQRDLNFNPGEQYTYCNTGFTLLAEVVARVSDMSFAEFTQQYIFKPLKMESTLFYDDHMKIVKNRAYSYQSIDEGFQKRVLSYANVGATSLFTTVEDIMKWSKNFETATVGNEKIFAQMNKEAELNNGDTFGGGMGQFFNRHNGHYQIQHGGADAGFRSYLGRFPEFDFSVAVFSNLGEFNPTGMSMEVANLFLPNPAEPEATAADAVEEDVSFVQLSKMQMEKFQGTYWNDAGSYSRTIYVNNDTLRYDRGNSESPLLPLSDSQYKMMGVSMDLRVSFEGTGAERKMIVRIDGGAPIISNAYIEPNYSDKELEAFSGNYYSAELNTNYILSVSEGGLVARHFRHRDMTFFPIKKDMFRANQWYFGNVRFERNAQDVVTGMKVSNGRVMNLFFEKKM